jgi:hypothetical protein
LILLAHKSLKISHLLEANAKRLTKAAWRISASRAQHAPALYALRTFSAPTHHSDVLADIEPEE